ncbi:hypothetical protein ED312_19660 [Sinomicrobium pectinilyticum]|uniref:Bacterial bifunctional deaminase-reductase C-terminal domain-containing protein n=1 Tax=Sinomicrobium pectinilyticum TaxID=1084421 RepID=A0A3N0DS18_SINP1|nr:dihydrofolate reductase family protein [Sinomicrobium pectinilyticum]RNL78153.1 hypothetical protein ED312_19660 [Sinomicrobium pectinilyticum]
MKVTVIANISANGKTLLSNNPHYQLPKEAMGFYLKYANKVGNLIIGWKTFENFRKFPKEIKEHFKGIKIIILADIPYEIEGYTVVGSPEEAIEHLTAEGLQEVAIGGGTGTFNAFIDKDLVTDLYFNISPVITGNGGVLGNNPVLSTKFKLAEHTVNEDNLLLHFTKL